VTPPAAPAKELLRRKRDGGALSAEEVRSLVAGITDGGLTDAQTGAFAMAVAIRGMDADEQVALTLAMRDSGRVMAWEGLDGPVLDKHSTGGVGDKVSLPLAPLLAACGAYVPMISGRGLGHTGGTLDKLEALPGYDTRPDPARLRATVEEVGCAVIGQTDDLAPADRRLYATRDATGSVESLPLIVASILSKKLAAGLGGLVMDVKHGSGAFMASLDDARELARALVDVAGGAGLPTVALLTDMDRVLGRTVGNALEVRESLEALRDLEAADERLVDVTLALARAALDLGGLRDADPEAVWRSGAAAEAFERMVAALGGALDLPRAPVVVEVEPEAEGVVLEHRTRDLGLVLLTLGGARAGEGDPIDHATGLAEVAAPGEAVAPGGRPLAVVHARTPEQAEAAAAQVRAAMPVGEFRKVPGTFRNPPIVTEVIA
jgi:thymidine phosphorylase